MNPSSPNGGALHPMSHAAQTAWFREHYAQWDQFVQAVVAGTERLEAWQEAGLPDLPPEYISAKEFFERLHL